MLEPFSKSVPLHILTRFPTVTILLPRGHFPMGVLDQRFEKNFMITSVDYVFNWARKSALWPLTFGLACCAIEMIASTTGTRLIR